MTWWLDVSQQACAQTDAYGVKDGCLGPAAIAKRCLHRQETSSNLHYSGFQLSSFVCFSFFPLTELSVWHCFSGALPLVPWGRRILTWCAVGRIIAVNFNGCFVNIYIYIYDIYVYIYIYIFFSPFVFYFLFIHGLCDFCSVLFPRFVNFVGNGSEHAFSENDVSSSVLGKNDPNLENFGDQQWYTMYRYIYLLFFSSFFPDWSCIQSCLWMCLYGQ